MVAEGLRLAELLGALSLATDLGMGQPLEQALRSCLIALALGERVGLDGEALCEVYYCALLRFLGCTADAHDMAKMAGGDEIALRAAIAPALGAPPREFAARVLPQVGAGQSALRRARLLTGMITAGQQRAREGLRAHCEMGENLAQRLMLPAGVRTGLVAAFEQWNGEGLPNGLAGEAIPVAARIVFLARDVEVLSRLGGSDRMREAIRSRAGVTYDPAIADALLRAPPEVLEVAQTSSPWEEALDREPEPRPWVPEARLDTVLSAFADFVDLKSPFTAGHSRKVAALADAAASPADAVSVRRAALVHDLGRVSVPNGIWDKPGPLTDVEWERVRLHAYYTERIVGRVKALSSLATLAGMHHERLDGSGYHRGCSTRRDPRARAAASYRRRLPRDDPAPAAPRRLARRESGRRASVNGHGGKARQRSGAGGADRGRPPTGPTAVCLAGGADRP